MPSNHTPNYQLSQWERTDKILMEDFNADNAKIDRALASLTGTTAAQAAAIESKGNCRIVWDTYTGSGSAGQSSPTSLTFDSKPLAVFLLPLSGGGGYPLSMFLLRGATVAYSCPYHPTSGNEVTWSENSVSWYGYAKSTEYQFSQKQKYVYIALFSMEE